MYDCVIIGGGLIGLLCARELTRAGLSVAVVERGRIGQESSWAGGGILSPLYPWRYADVVTALASWSQQHYPAFAQVLQQESGIDPEYQQNGLLILDTNEQQQAQSWARQWQRHLDILNQNELRKVEPELGDTPERALWFPEVGQIRNPRFVQAARQSLLNSKVTLIEDTPITGLALKGKQLSGVMTRQNRIEANKVVVAGGAWSAQLLESTGITLSVKPIRGQMILFHGPAGKVSRIVLSRDRYVIPRRDGRVLVGSTLEDVGFDKTTTQAARDELLAEAKRLIPALGQFEIEHQWAGLRPGSPQGIPYIGEHPLIQGLFINTGHFRNGVVLGLASARLLADLMLEQAPIVNPAPYATSLV